MKQFFTHMSAVFLILSLATPVVGEETPRDLGQSLQSNRQKEVLLTQQLATLREKADYSLYLKYMGMEAAFMCGVLAVLFGRPLRSVSIVAGALAGATATKAHIDGEGHQLHLKEAQHRLQDVQGAIASEKEQLTELKKASAPQSK